MALATFQNVFVAGAGAIVRCCCCWKCQAKEILSTLKRQQSNKLRRDRKFTCHWQKKKKRSHSNHCSLWLSYFKFCSNGKTFTRWKLMDININLIYLFVWRKFYLKFLLIGFISIVLYISNTIHLLSFFYGMLKYCLNCFRYSNQWIILTILSPTTKL